MFYPLMVWTFSILLENYLDFVLLCWAGPKEKKKRSFCVGPAAGQKRKKKKRMLTAHNPATMEASATNFAEALGGNRSPQEEKIAKRRDKKRKEWVLADLANGEG